MQGSNNPFTADNENSVLNGSWREGKFRLKHATNFKPLAPLCGKAHTHTPRGSNTFILYQKKKKSKIDLLLG